MCERGPFGYETGVGGEAGVSRSCVLMAIVVRVTWRCSSYGVCSVLDCWVKDLSIDEGNCE